MKEYLQLFRDQAFTGAFTLAKRVLLSNILITIILSIVSLLAILPLILQSIGWGISDIISFKDKMQDMPKTMTSPEEMQDFFLGMFSNINYGFVALTIIVVLLFSAYRYVVFFKLNDNTVRNNNTGIMDALKVPFSQILGMLGLYIILSLLTSTIIFVYILLLVPIFMGSKILGVLIGFILFFVVVIFIIRFMIAPAAFVHGNLSVTKAIEYSFKKITWKRAGILFLMGLVFIIAMLMVTGLISSITGAIFGMTNTNMTAFVIGQIISSALGAVLTAFFYCALTAIYFRYSDDMTEDSGTVEDHLIN